MSRFPSEEKAISIFLSLSLSLFRISFIQFISKWRYSSQNEAGFSKKWETWSHRPLNIPWGHQLPGHHQGGIPTINISNIDVANTQYIVDSIINRHFLGLLHVSFGEREVWMSHIYIYNYIYSSLPAFLWYTHQNKTMEPTKNGPGRLSSYRI